MKPGSLLAIVLATLALVSTAAPSVPTRGTVVIAPVHVAFDKSWLENMNGSRGRTAVIGAEDARQIAADMAASLESALDAAVRARGFEVVRTPGAGSVSLAVRIDDLYVNAPDLHSSSNSRSFVREAGRATLRAEGRDPSGTVHLKAERRGTAGDTGQLVRATDVSNRFWFDALFRNWAAEVADELSARAPH